MRLATNLQRWSDISFLHWPFHPDVVAPLVPDPLRPLLWDGRAWVSVTPFTISVRPPIASFIPLGRAFPETNLRTYVADPDDREGVWFLRAEVTALWFLLTLRSLGLPYHEMRMEVGAGDGTISYRSRPGGSHGGHHVRVRPGPALFPAYGGPFDRFVTARWFGYHARGPFLLRTPVEHAPWPLQSAEALRCDVDPLFTAAGLPPPAGPPMVHFSKGVEVRVGAPQVVALGR